MAYSWVNKNGNTKFGISFVPSSFITGSVVFTNHAIKGKSFRQSLITNTTLTDLFDAGALINLIGNDPGKNATNFQLLGIGSALVNLDVAGTNVTGNFNGFQINNVDLAKAIGAQNVINCSPFLPNNQPAAAAAARAH